MSESLRDRVDTASSYMLGDLTVTVIPRSGIVWHEPDNRLAFERDLLADDRLTAADVRSLYAEPGPLLPPTDVVSGGAFACCAGCAAARPTERCTGCPRGRPRLHVTRTYDRQPRRRSWRPWRKDRP